MKLNNSNKGGEIMRIVLSVNYMFAVYVCAIYSINIIL